MSRHSLLRCASLGVAFGLAAAVPILPAYGQDRSTFERLDRLERDLNMLQRQVYRGGPTPLAAAGDPGVAMNAEIRMDRIESQMRDLTGRVEEFMNQVERLRQRLDQVNGDAEPRLSQAPPGSGAYAAAIPPPPTARSRGGASGREPPPEPAGPPAGTLAPPGAPPPGLGGPLVLPGALLPPQSGLAPVAGTLTPPAAPAGSPELAAAARPPSTRPLPCR